MERDLNKELNWADMFGNPLDDIQKFHDEFKTEASGRKVTILCDGKKAFIKEELNLPRFLYSNSIEEGTIILYDNYLLDKYTQNNIKKGLDHDEAIIQAIRQMGEEGAIIKMININDEND